MNLTRSLPRPDEAGALLFLPYLAVYIIAWALQIPVPAVTIIFWGLHALYLAWFFTAAREAGLQTLLPWLAVFVVLALPGAYLEYPSDAWEHFRRLYSWQTIPTIGTSETWHKFSYFWGWTILGSIPIPYRRFALGLYSSFWLTFTARMIYRFALRLSDDKRAPALKTFAYLGLFGSNIFGLRYYSTSSTILALIAFVQVETTLLDFLQRRRKVLWTIPLLLAVMALNHAEEIILTALASAAILIGHWYEKAPAPKRRLFLRAFLIACILSAVAGWVAMRINGYFFIAHIRNTVPELTRYGSLKIWSRTGPFADTIGISGVVSLLLALVFFRQFPIEGALTIAPFFVVLCPATALLLCWLMPTGYILYRIFYVLPFGFILVSSLLRALPFWAAGLLVAALAFPPAFPWRGRLAFLLYRAPAVREFTHLDQTARWIKENRPGILTCELITDDITDWVVSTHLGRNFSRANRLAPRLLTQKLDTTEKILDHAQKHKACGVLVARRSELPAETPSRAARLSHHWDENKGDQSWQISAEFEAAAAGLTNNHWTQIPVPPFYNLYEPVDHVRNHGKEFYPRSDHP